MTVSALVRAAIFVENLEVSRSFYTNVLGFEDVYFESELKDDTVAALLGMPTSLETRCCILKKPGPIIGMIGLFELSNPKPEPVQRREDGASLKDIWLVFYADELDPIVERLQSGGHRIVCLPRDLKIPGASGQREMTCADPNGVLINLIERPSADVMKPDG